jgi:hypothetical protein
LATYIDETARLLGGGPGGGGGAPMLTTRFRDGGGARGVSDVPELAIAVLTGGAGGGARLVRLGIGGAARAGSEGA